MSAELEILTATLYIVGGRALHAAPPGALVQAAPRRTSRARAQDTFFALLTLSGEVRTPASVYEALVRRAAETYFKSTGTVTASLREAILAVNADLMERNRQSGAGHRAHVACAALRSGEVYVAQAGACASWLQQSGAVEIFPEDPADLQSKGVGVGTSPDVRLTKYTVAPGDMFMLSEAALAGSVRAKVEAALKSDTPAAVVETLKPLAGDSASALVVQFVAPGQAPVIEAPAPTEAEAAKEPVPKAPPKKEPVAARTPTTGPKLPERITLSRAGGRLRDLGAAAGDAARNLEVGRWLRTAGAALATGVARLAANLNRLLDVFFPEPTEEDAGPRIPTPLAAGATVLIAVVVTVVVVGLMLRNYGRDSCEDFVLMAEEEAALAKTLTGHPQEAREAWEAVMLHLSQAGEVCPPTDRRPAEAMDEARGFIDEYDQVVRPRPAVTRLRTFPAGAEIVAPVLHAPDIYTLDVQNAALYRDQLMESGYQLLEENSKPVLKQGDTVEGYAIRRLVDIEWLEEGSVRTRNVLVTLEPTSGLIVAYSPTLPTQAIPLAGWEQWQEPVAISTWGGNIYILDASADQIWRYRVAQDTGDYTAPPERYFENLNTNPDLAGAIDMAIDDQGNIYVLFGDGKVSKLWGGEAQEFNLIGLPIPLKQARSMYLDSGPFAQALYLVDAGNESIFETTLRGNFNYHYRPANPETFKDLRGIYVKAGAGDVYMTANNALYYFNKGTRQ